MDYEIDEDFEYDSMIDDKLTGDYEPNVKYEEEKEPEEITFDTKYRWVRIEN